MSDKEKKKAKEVDIGGVKGLSLDNGDAFMAQAADGSLIVGNKTALVEKALSTSSAGSKLKLQTGKTVSVVVNANVLKMAMSEGKGNPFAEHASKIGDTSLSVDVASATAEVRITMGDDAAAKGLVDMLQKVAGEMAKKKARGPEALIFGALNDVKINAQGADVVATLPIPMAALGEAAKELAKEIERELK
jgi:hypothetical protein